MLGFYYSTDKITRIRPMFIVTVSVIRCWLCSSTNHNSARCHLHTAPRRVYIASHNRRGARGSNLGLPHWL